VQRDYPDPAVLAKLGGLPLFARQAMLGVVSGRHRSPVRGSSLEFAEYRKYQPGDDLRRLDWRAWGRSDRYYVKEFEADTNLRLVFLIDVSGSMGFAGPDGKTKLDQAKRLAATLAFIAANQGDAVGLYAAGSEGLVGEVPAKRGGVHLGVVLDELDKLKAEGETGMEAALHAVAETVGQRALVVVISDLFLQPEALKDAFQHLRFRKHDVSCFHLLDQKEIDFSFERPTRFLDLEGSPSMLVDPALISKRYREAVQHYLSVVDATILDAAVDYHRIDLDAADDEVLSRFLLARAPKKR